MTLEQIQSLTDDEIRVRVAEIMGWSEISTRCMWGLPPGAEDDGTEDSLKHFPNYPADLNACADMECMLTDAQWITYIARLHNDVVIYPTRLAVAATARQRCEAFLAVMGKGAA